MNNGKWVSFSFKVFCFNFITHAITFAQLDCGIRPSRPFQNPWTEAKYGPYGWDNPQIARREDFPWQVGIFKKVDGSFKYQCGGTLIPAAQENEMLVLTAARCVTDAINSTKPESNHEKLRVVVGPYSSNYNKNDYENGSQKFGISKIEIHPLYQAKKHDSDIAIVKVDREIESSPLAVPVCLPPSQATDMGVTFGMVGEIAGFGWDTRRNVTESLRYAMYPIVQGSTCQNKLAVKVNDFLEFCTGNEKDSTSCQGDYGGGLVFQQPKINGRYFLQGMLSVLDTTPVSGEGYCENYNVFKRIGPYLSWIKETQEKMDKDEVQYNKPKPTPGYPLSHRVPEFAKIARDLHNYYRGVHKVPTVRLVGKVQDEAQKLAEELVEDGELEEGKADDYPYSFNTYLIPRRLGAAEAVREAMQYWYGNFFPQYEHNDPQPSPFTQIVWKSSTQIGVGVATDGKKTAVVVNYWPKGNILYLGERKHQRQKVFDDNVNPVKQRF